MDVFPGTAPILIIGAVIVIVVVLAIVWSRRR